MFVHMNIYIFLYTCLYLYICICINTFLNILIFVYVHLFVLIYIYTYIYTYIYVFFFYMQIIKACGHGSSHLGDCVHDGMPRASTRSQAHVMSKRAKLGDRGLLSSGLQDAHVPEVYTGNQARERGGGCMQYAVCAVYTACIEVASRCVSYAPSHSCFAHHRVHMCLSLVTGHLRQHTRNLMLHL